MIKDIRKSLKVGSSYVLTYRNHVGKNVQTKRRKMKLKGVYTHHAVFMTKYGYTVSFTYHDLIELIPTYV